MNPWHPPGLGCGVIGWRGLSARSRENGSRHGLLPVVINSANILHVAVSSHAPSERRFILGGLDGLGGENISTELTRLHAV